MLVRRPSSIALGMACLCLALPAAGLRAEAIVFRSAIDGSPLDLTPKPGEVETAAVKKFKKTGRNPYNGQERALRDLWKSASLEALNKKYADDLKGRRITEAVRQQQLADLEGDLAFRQIELGSEPPRLVEASLQGVDSAAGANMKLDEAGATNVLLRCRIHGHTGLSDGSVHQAPKK